MPCCSCLSGVADAVAVAGSERTVLVVLSAAGVALLHPVRAKTMTKCSKDRFGGMPPIVRARPAFDPCPVWCITVVGWDPYDEPQSAAASRSANGAGREAPR